MILSRFHQLKIWQKLLVVVGGIFGAIFCVGIIVGMIQGAMEIANPPKKETQAAAGSPSPVSSPTPAALSPSEQLAKAKEMAKGAPSAADVDAVIALLQLIPADANEHKEAQTLLKQMQEKSEKIKSEDAKIRAEEAILGPKPEGSAWNGTVAPVDRYLKRTLNDYDSAEYVEWSQVIKSEWQGKPAWAVKLKLRAKNAFGAKIIKDVIFFIRQNEVIEAVGL
jgi:hypothetical protein